jgi:hypothetical protein
MSLTINMGGGGGAPVTVVGGSTQPASASEKTIWVDTSTTITSYVFSFAEPSVPVNGMVWVKTGTSSPVEFNASNGNNVLMVYPNQCKQYVSGAWEAKTAKSYLNGAWQDWAIWLFMVGSGQIVEWTGYSISGSSYDIDSTEHMTLKAETNAYPERSVYTGLLNLTDISTIYFDIECVSGTPSNTACGVTTDNPAIYSFCQNPTGTFERPTQSARYTLSVDVSSVSGSAKVFICGNLAGEERIYNVWMS